MRLQDGLVNLCPGNGSCTANGSIAFIVLLEFPHNQDNSYSGHLNPLVREVGDERSVPTHLLDAQEIYFKDESHVRTDLAACAFFSIRKLGWYKNLPF